MEALILMSPEFWEISAAPSFLAAVGVLIAIWLTQKDYIRAVLRDQKRARMLRAARTARR